MAKALTKSRRRPVSKSASGKPKPGTSFGRKALARPPKPKKTSRAKISASNSDALAPERIQQILKRLDERYPGVTCALKHHSAWELLVATILSAQCTDATVNKVTPELFKKYPTPQAFAVLQPEQLEPDIRSTGFFRNKSKSLVGAAKGVVENFHGDVPAEMDALLTLPGVAR